MERNRSVSASRPNLEDADERTLLFIRRALDSLTRDELLEVAMKAAHTAPDALTAAIIEVSDLT